MRFPDSYIQGTVAIQFETWRALSTEYIRRDWSPDIHIPHFPGFLRSRFAIFTFSRYPPGDSSNTWLLYPNMRRYCCCLPYSRDGRRMFRYTNDMDIYLSTNPPKTYRHHLPTTSTHNTSSLHVNSKPNPPSHHSPPQP